MRNGAASVAFTAGANGEDRYGAKQVAIRINLFSHVSLPSSAAQQPPATAFEVASVRL
jgi:hypothetical protein